MIIGLDVSTRITGYTVLNLNGEIIEMNHIDFSKIDNIWWEKVDFLKDKVKQIKSKYPNINKIFIEESLQTFKSGFSSAQTLSTLAKFNIITAFLFREEFNISPEYISASSARKTCGIKIEKKSEKAAKEQVIQYLLETTFKNNNFPFKKTGAIKDFIKDQLDSYVIAKAGLIQINANKK
jgi:hypothetical protein